MLSRMTTYGDFRQGRYTRGILTGLQTTFLKKKTNTPKKPKKNKKTQPKPKVFTSLTLHICKLKPVII